jgi:hypothetical protein
MCSRKKDVLMIIFPVKLQQRCREKKLALCQPVSIHTKLPKLTNEDATLLLPTISNNRV